MTDPDRSAQDQVVLSAAQSTDPLVDGFRTLFATELDYVCHSLRRLGVREADLEDVAQDVFMAVHSRFTEYDAARPARPWLFSFACRVAANYRRLARHRRELHEEDPDRNRSSGSTPEEETERAQQLAFVQDALNEMDFDRRVALVMHDLDGFTAPQIATALEIPLNTVYSRVRKARIEFRDIAKRQRTRRGQS